MGGGLVGGKEQSRRREAAVKKAPRRAVVKFYRYESSVFLGDMTLSCGHEKLWDSDRRPPATTQCWKCAKEVNNSVDSGKATP